MNADEHVTPTSVKDAAAYWANRLSSPDCGPADRKAFTAWRNADPQHADAYEKTQKALRIIDRHMGHPELEAMAGEVLAETEPPSAKERVGGWGRWASAAAAAMVLMTAGVVGFSVFGNDPAAVQVAEYYETAIGERSTVTLSDGSTVALNTNSRIEVNFQAERRDIALVRGQALFEVAKDATRPFVVEAGNQRITAIGTAFDVRLDEDDEVKVVLVEGLIAVDELVAIDGAPEPVVNEEKRIEMTAGEALVASVNVERIAEPADIEQATSWREGRLLFRSTPIVEAIDEINRYSVEQLRLTDDPRWADVTVNGVFNAGRSESFVLALETMHGLNAQRTARNEITLFPQEN